MAHASSAVGVAKGVSYLGSQLIITSLIRIVAFAFLARLISLADMGLLTIILTIYSGAQIVSGLGVSNITTKFVAENAASGKVKVAAGVFYVSLVVSALASVAVAVVIAFPSPLTATLREPGDATFAIYAAPLLALDIVVNLSQITSSALAGLQKFRELAIINIAYSGTRQVLILLLVATWHSLTGLLVAWVISDCIATAAMVVYIMRFLGPPTLGFSTWRLLGMSAPLLVSSLASYVYNYFDRIVLIGFVDLSTLGIYGAAVEAFSAYTSVVGVLSTVLLPAFAYHRTKGEHALSEALATALRYVAYAAIPIAFGLLATARPALTLFVGPAYTSGWLPLAILSGASIAVIISGTLAAVLIVLEETSLLAVASLLSFAVGAAIAYMIVPLAGMVGASTARGIAMGINLFVIFLFLRRRIELSLDLKALFKSMFAGLVLAVVVEFAQVVWYDKLLLPVYALIGILSYLCALRGLRAITARDIVLLRGLAGRFDFLVLLLGRFLVGGKNMTQKEGI